MLRLQLRMRRRRRDRFEPGNSNGAMRLRSETLQFGICNAVRIRIRSETLQFFCKQNFKMLH